MGEPFWRTWPLPEEVDDQGYVALSATVERLERAGLRLTGIVASSEDDWDVYESLHWRAAEEWLAENARSADAGDVRVRHEAHRREYLTGGRSLLGWAIFAARRLS